MFDRLSRYRSEALALLRIFAGALFFAHGLVKLFGWPAGTAPGQQDIMTLVGFAGVLELVLGTLIVIGLFTRLAAFLASGEMAVAYFMYHFTVGLHPLANKGELSILYCFIFLYLATAGPGRWSVDGRRETVTP